MMTLLGQKQLPEETQQTPESDVGRCDTYPMGNRVNSHESRQLNRHSEFVGKNLTKDVIVSYVVKVEPMSCED